jgi:ABC-type multidrug transport system fused ATPase/permease subunit
VQLFKEASPMKRLTNFLALGAVIGVAALAALNWSTLMVPATLDLVVTQVQVPLGATMLGLAGVLVALLFVAYLSNQIGSLLETRKLLQEIHRVQNLADKAEASRLENLHHLIATEFRLLDERLSAALATRNVPPGADVALRDESPEFRPSSLTDIVTGRDAR